jgi:hypothetical protein
LPRHAKMLTHRSLLYQWRGATASSAPKSDVATMCS